MQAMSRMPLLCAKVLLPLLLLAVLCAAVWAQEGCQMWGQDGAMNPPTVYHGPPKAANPPITDCTEMLDEHGLGCCSHDQAVTFHESFKRAEFTFFRCPACVQNIKTLWCAFTCSYMQDSFLESTAGPKKTPSGLPIVGNVNFYVTERFSQTLYDSCKDNPFAGALPLGQFVPTPAAFLMMLQLETPYIKISTASTGLDLPLRNCSESCSCNFCRGACHRDNNYGDNDTGKKYDIGIAELTLLQFIMGIVFVSVSLVVIVVAVIVAIVQSKKSGSDRYTPVQ